MIKTEKAVDYTILRFTPDRVLIVLPLHGFKPNFYFSPASGELQTDQFV